MLFMQTLLTHMHVPLEKKIHNYTYIMQLPKRHLIKLKKKKKALQIKIILEIRIAWPTVK